MSEKTPQTAGQGSSEKNAWVDTYNDMLQDKYKGDSFDEAEFGSANQSETADSQGFSEKNPWVDAYDDMLHDKYTSGSFDEAESGAPDVPETADSQKNLAAALYEAYASGDVGAVKKAKEALRSSVSAQVETPSSAAKPEAADSQGSSEKNTWVDDEQSQEPVIEPGATVSISGQEWTVGAVRENPRTGKVEFVAYHPDENDHGRNTRGMFSEDDLKVTKEPVSPEIGPAPAPTAEDYEAVGQTPPSAETSDSVGNEKNLAAALNEAYANGDVEAVKNIKEGLLQNRESEVLEDSLARVRKEYAAARVDVESHFFKKFFGGKDRQQRLDDLAEQMKGLELAVAKQKFASEIQQLKDRAGEDDEEAQQQQEALAGLMAAHVVENMQKTEQETADQFDTMLDERSKVHKIMAKAGRWFTKDGRMKQWLKLGGTGAVAGAVTKMVAGWPVTTAVGLAAGVGVGNAVKQSVLEERRGEQRLNIDASDAQLALQQEAKNANASDENEALGAMVEASVGLTKEESEKKQEELRKKVRGAMGKFALGFAAGGAAANLLQSTLFGAEHAPTAVASEGGSTPSPDVATPGSDATAGAELGRANPVDLVSGTEGLGSGGYEYPWDWASEMFGDADAAQRLHELGEAAQANGHNVEWISVGGTEMVTVDGIYDTQYVVDVLSQYVN